MANLLAVSDLHVGYAENKAFVDTIRPLDDGDWLIVAGDVADYFDEIIATLSVLRERFETVVWVPGNHELWSLPADSVSTRGLSRYEALVQALRRVGVLTPEDPYPIWRGVLGPVVVAPLFVLYDYTFRPQGVESKEAALAAAQAAGVMCSDEVLLHADPFTTREAWCAARLRYTRARLDLLSDDARTVLVSHWPLVRAPTAVLRYPEFALWCGTEHTADWPIRYRALAAVYGHLHIPRTIEVDGVPHHEVSLGYPREWQRPGALTRQVKRILDHASERAHS